MYLDPGRDYWVPIIVEHSVGQLAEVSCRQSNTSPPLDPKITVIGECRTKVLGSVAQIFSSVPFT